MKVKKKERWRHPVYYHKHYGKIVDKRYAISSFGRYIRLDPSYNSITMKPLPFGYAGYGYSQINYRSKGISFRWYVHRLVIETFVGPCPKGLEVNHINGNKKDNRLSNLEYVSKSENIKLSYRLPDGTKPKSAIRRHPHTKLSNLQAKEVRKLLAQGNMTQKQISKRFGISRACLWQIIVKISYDYADCYPD